MIFWENLDHTCQIPLFNHTAQPQTWCLNSMIASQTKMDRSHKNCGVLRRAKQSHIMLNLGRYRLDLASDNLSNLDQNRLPCGLSTFKYISNRQIFRHTAWPTIPWPDPTTKSWDPMVSIPKHSLMFLILVMVDQWSSCYIERFLPIWASAIGWPQPPDQEWSLPCSGGGGTFWCLKAIDPSCIKVSEVVWSKGNEK